MKEQLSIVRECYEQLPTLPGFYKNWTDLANAVNHALLAQSMDPIDEVSLSKLVQDSFKVKIENEYKRGDERFPAIRIYLPKPIPTMSEEEKSSLKKRIATILFEKMNNENGWYELVKIAPVLKTAGVDYESIGFQKLIEMLKSVFDVDFKCEERGDSMHPNMKYVHLNVNMFADEKAIPFSFNNQATDQKQDTKVKKNKSDAFAPKTTDGCRSLVQASSNELKPHEIRNAYRKLVKELEGWVPIKDFMKEIKWDDTPKQLTQKYPFLQFNPTDQSVRVHNISKYEIIDDIYFDPNKNSFPSSMEKLREMTLDEKWDDGLLENYIQYTYARIKDEKKIAISNDSLYACWNTGLVDYRYEPIFCYLYRKDTTNRWMFKAFCIVGEDEGKEMNNNISAMPECAMYFEGADLLCQPTKDNLPVDKDHIIREHPSRLPSEWLEQAIGEKAKWEVNETAMAYDRRVSELLPKDSEKNLMLNTFLKQSIDESIKRCQWNYKTAIPYYDPTSKKLGWFLPLCIRKTKVLDGKVQLVPFAALVVTKGKSGRFQGETIYSLSWAYRCARLVCRPDSDWLTPIKDEKTDAEDE